MSKKKKFYKRKKSLNSNNKQIFQIKECHIQVIINIKSEILFNLTKI